MTPTTMTWTFRPASPTSPRRNHKTDQIRLRQDTNQVLHYEFKCFCNCIRANNHTFLTMNKCYVCFYFWIQNNVGLIQINDKRNTIQQPTISIDVWFASKDLRRPAEQEEQYKYNIQNTINFEKLRSQQQHKQNDVMIATAVSFSLIFCIYLIFVTGFWTI